jgi:hypothetical protein
MRTDKINSSFCQQCGTGISIASDAIRRALAPMPSDAGGIIAHAAQV